MKKDAFRKLMDIRKRDPKYSLEAYIFLREALEFAGRKYGVIAHNSPRHVSAHELLDGFKEVALQAFGPLSYKVLTLWGLERTEDIGKMVFYLVEADELGKTDEDKIEDFNQGYDFYETFAQPFLPDKTS